MGMFVNGIPALDYSVPYGCAVDASPVAYRDVVAAAAVVVGQVVVDLQPHSPQSRPATRMELHYHVEPA